MTRPEHTRRKELSRPASRSSDEATCAGLLVIVEDVEQLTNGSADFLENLGEGFWKGYLPTSQRWCDNFGFLVTDQSLNLGINRYHDYKIPSVVSVPRLQAS